VAQDGILRLLAKAIELLKPVASEPESGARCRLAPQNMEGKDGPRMTRGEFLTRVTIWFALGGYFIGATTSLMSRERREWESLARMAWTAGCLSLLVHVAFAFNYYHAWSHDLAYRATASQTAEVVGYNWGGGLFINYALIAAWVIDVFWWWVGFEAYRRRPWLLSAIWHGFLFFIIFNSTVIFKTGPLRWIGLGLCLGLSFLWLRRSLRVWESGNLGVRESEDRSQKTI
jgi:hypothetical protein